MHWQSCMFRGAMWLESIERACLATVSIHFLDAHSVIVHKRRVVLCDVANYFACPIG